MISFAVVAAEDPVGREAGDIHGGESSYLTNRLEVGKDGKNRVRKIPREAGSRCGCQVRREALVKRHVRKQAGESQSEMGVWRACGPEGDQWVAKEGLQAVRSVRRLLVEERWSLFNAEFVKHVP